MVDYKNSDSQIKMPCPDGRPLYQYRITRKQFDLLQAYLSDNYKTLKNPNLSHKNEKLYQAFVLYSAEWWRREYNGDWGWERLLDSINPELNYEDTQHFLDITERGCKRWGRPVCTNANGRTAMGTFLKEGGLPINYFTQKGGWLDVLYTAIEQKAKGKDLQYYFKSNDYRLPKSSNTEEITQLLIDLVETIHDLVVKYDLSNHEDPMTHLNQVNDDWEISLPFSIDDEEADKFLTKLIVDSTNAKKNAQLNSSQNNTNDDWFESISLQRLIKVYKSDKSVDLEARIIAPNTLYLGDNIEKIYDEDVTLSFDILEQENRHNKCIIEGDNNNLPAWYANPLDQERKLLLSSATKNIIIDEDYWHTATLLSIKDSLGELFEDLVDNKNTPINPYQNSSMFEVDTSLPFIALIKDENDERVISEYLGTFVRTIQEEEALVFVPENWSASQNEATKFECIAPLCNNSFKGNIYLLKGSVTLESGNHTISFKTSCKDANYRYEVVGNISSDFVYPSLVVEKSSFKVVKIDRNDQTSKIDVPSYEVWLARINENNDLDNFRNLCQLKNLDAGCYRLQVRDDNHDILFQTTIGLVPNNFSYSLYPNKSVTINSNDESQYGRIKFESKEALILSAYAPNELSVIPDGEDQLSFKLHISRLPTDKITFALSFKEYTKAMRLRCNFPMIESYIYDAKGNRLESKNLPLCVSSDLRGYKLKIYNSKSQEVKLYFKLESQQELAKTKTFTVAGGKVLVLDPESWLSNIRELIFLSKEGLDDIVTVEVVIDQQVITEIPFGYYNYQLSIDYEEDPKNNIVYLENHQSYRAAIDESILSTHKRIYELTDIKALNLSDPSELITLPKTAIPTNNQDAFSYSDQLSWSLEELSNYDTEKFLLIAEPNTETNFPENTSIRSALYEAARKLNYNSRPQSGITEPVVIRKKNKKEFDIKNLKRNSDKGLNLNDSKKKEGRISRNIANKPKKSFKESKPEQISLDFDNLDSIQAHQNSDNESLSTNYPVKGKTPDSALLNDNPNELNQDKSIPSNSSFAAASLLSHQSRGDTLRAVCRKMAFDPENPNWSYLKSTTEACIHLPLVTLENWINAKQVPEFMCAVAVFGDSLLGKEIVDKVKSELKFVWEFITFDDFLKIWRIMLGRYQSLFTVDPETLNQINRLKKQSSNYYLTVFREVQKYKGPLSSLVFYRKDKDDSEEFYESCIAKCEESLTNLSPVFQTYLNVIKEGQAYASSLNQAPLLLNSLILRKIRKDKDSHKDIDWPNNSVEETVIKVIHLIEQIHGLPTDTKNSCQPYYFNKQNLETVHRLSSGTNFKDMLNTIYLPIVIAWLAAQPSHCDLYFIKDDESRIPNDINALNKLKKLRKELRVNYPAVHEVIDFSPRWFSDTFQYAFIFFYNYRKMA